MEERIALVRAYYSGVSTVQDLSARFGVGREMFYTWRHRRDSGDDRWFEDKSRAPHHCPHATASDVVLKLLALREKFPHFGEKLKARLAMDETDLVVPSASMVGDILNRHDLIEPKHRRCRSLDQG